MGIPSVEKQILFQMDYIQKELYNSVQAGDIATSHMHYKELKRLQELLEGSRTPVNCLENILIDLNKINE